ncbi:UNVERIFIED_CONTAM: Alpha carbonic anhydrase 4 [Sesamum angustifolium]|uniref:Carbonic anhydrase n=1 Tax=Sesamum angustifolium TaxID=2727405 RepID=A0AAW2PVX9_9LAMI
MWTVFTVSLFATRTAGMQDESPFTYDWNSDKGPGNWGNLDRNWKACGVGKLQSPIDLNDDRVSILHTLGNLKRTYKPAPAVIKNRGHDIMVSYLVHVVSLGILFWFQRLLLQLLARSFVSMFFLFVRSSVGGRCRRRLINGTEFKLLQSHWHTPSEHTVDGKRFKMEIHMVHKNSHGQISVVGILYKLGRPDAFLAKLLEHIKTAGHQGKHVGFVDPWDVKFGSRKYYRYIGSLTVPPCTEGVLWTILKKVRTVSLEQIRALRDAVHDGFEENARPIQQSDDITVYMYRPKA